MEARTRQSSRWSRLLAGLAAGAALHGAAAARAPDPAVQHPDYADPALWLCRPDLADNRCKVDLDATVVAPSGKMTIERFVPAKDPNIDCFFVYPTVSRDQGWLSDFDPDQAEWDDIKVQFARFGAACRQFAPLYRQGTLKGLRVAMGGPAPAGERPPPTFGGFNDVRAAWDWYMAHENQGRGVVLIGHSQGGAMIARLVAEAIDGKPAQKQFVSAIILGAPVMVPPDKHVGGTFKTVPLCRAEAQLGCVISYASFRDRNPPPKNSWFGRARDGLRVACVNPANLAGGSGEPESYFLTSGSLNGSGGDIKPRWTYPPRPIATFFVRTPGLVTTACVRTPEFDYLSMHVNADPKDPRTDEVPGEILRLTGADFAWGLHILDVDHSMGDLVRIVRKQGAAYGRAAR